MDLTTFGLDVGAALLMGTAIGLERQFGQHPAGLRTNALVCVGAALFVSVDRLLYTEANATRVAGQVVTGIGFLGGGVILREGFTVRGLNTAATLWCSAAVGTLAGLSFVIHGAIGMAVILGINLCFQPVLRWIDARTKGMVEVETLYRLRVVCPTGREGVVRTTLLRDVNAQPNLSIHGISTQEAAQDGMLAVVAQVCSSQRNDHVMNELVATLGLEPDVSAVSWEKAS